MACERLMLSMLYRCWERRIGSRLDLFRRTIDPVREINSRLLPHARPAMLSMTATARKPLKIIHDTLKNGGVFEDFPTFKLAEIKPSAGQTS